MGYSPWGRKESDTTEQLSTSCAKGDCQDFQDEGLPESKEVAVDPDPGSTDFRFSASLLPLGRVPWLSNTGFFKSEVLVR